MLVYCRSCEIPNFETFSIRFAWRLKQTIKIWLLNKHFWSPVSDLQLKKPFWRQSCGKFF